MASDLKLRENGFGRDVIKVCSLGVLGVDIRENVGFHIEVRE